MRIIPAIDLIDGKCVRLTQGDYGQKKTYHESPGDMARQFEDAGLQYIHVVDLDGAKAGQVVNWKALEAIRAKTRLQIDFGGGVKTKEEMDRLFQLGVSQVNLGSLAVKEKEKVALWIGEYGAERIVLSADVKDERIAIQGWMKDSGISLTDFVQDYLQKGIQYIACTDISTDGMLTGPNIGLYKKLIGLFPKVQLIASGGVSSMDDVRSLHSIGVDGVIIGKAIYEGKITLTELGEFQPC